MDYQKAIDIVLSGATHIKEWFYGEYMFNTTEPYEFVSCMRDLRPYLTRYQTTELFRWAWLSNDDFRLVNNADRVSVRTAKRKTQSWTDLYASAEMFGEEIGRFRGKVPSGYSMRIFSAMVPAKDILVNHEDLMRLLKEIMKDMEPSKDKTSIRLLQSALSGYEDQQEWIVYLEDTIEVNDIKVRVPDKEYPYARADYESVMAAENPKHVIIVIDDPDSGKSHIEIPGQGESTPDNVVPFKREEPAQRAASFISRLLQ